MTTTTVDWNERNAVKSKVVALINQRGKEFAALSPYPLSIGSPEAQVDRAVQMAVAEFDLYVSQKPEVLACTPHSITTALLRHIQTGLVLGTTAFIVPFEMKKSKKSIAVWMAQYTGLMELAYLSKVRAINAGVARKGDPFEFSLGSSPFVNHAPVRGNRAEVLWAWATARTGPGPDDLVVIVLDREKLLELKNEYANADVQKQALEDILWWPRKTAIRHLCNLLPKSPRLALAMRFDAATEGLDDDEGYERKHQLGVTVQATMDTGSSDAGHPVEEPESVPVFPRETKLPDGTFAGKMVKELPVKFLLWAVDPAPPKNFGLDHDAWMDVFTRELTIRREAEVAASQGGR